MPHYVSANRLAAMLDVTTETIRRWRRENKLPPARKLHGVLRWNVDEVAEWMDQQAEVTVPASEELSHATR